jgi:small nuclear ribonucleoprotein (snRNP)-like protein
MPPSRQRVVSEYLGSRITVGTTDGDALVGRFLGYDKFMNVVLSDCERTRTQRNGKQVRRHMGFVVLRGEYVDTIACIESVTTARTHVDSKLAPASTAAAAALDFQAVVKATQVLQGPVAGLSS